MTDHTINTNKIKLFFGFNLTKLGLMIAIAVLSFFAFVFALAIAYKCAMSLGCTDTSIAEKIVLSAFYVLDWMVLVCIQLSPSGLGVNVFYHWLYIFIFIILEIAYLYFIACTVAKIIPRYDFTGTKIALFIRVNKKQIVLFLITLLLSYIFTAVFGNLYFVFFTLISQIDTDFLFEAGLLSSYIFYLPFLFTAFGDSKKYWWIVILLIPAFFIELSFDIKHIYFPILVCLAGWLLGFGLEKLVRILRKPKTV